MTGQCTRVPMLTFRLYPKHEHSNRKCKSTINSIMDNVEYCVVDVAAQGRSVPKDNVARPYARNGTLSLGMGCTQNSEETTERLSNDHNNWI